MRLRLPAVADREPVPSTSMTEDVEPYPVLSYSRRETPAEVWANRVGVTGTLFAIAMSVSYFLGRPRR